ELVHRVAEEAVKSATNSLNMWIRALDYIPPVDITFVEYLRGLITADSDLVEDDRYNYRVAFVEAFRRRGIYPLDLPTLSVDTLRWQGADLLTMTRKHPKMAKEMKIIIEKLKSYVEACLYISDREILFKETRKQRALLHQTLEDVFAALPGAGA